MATQQQVVKFIRDSYRVEGETKDGQDTLLVLNLAFSNGRKQQAILGVDKNLFVFSPFAQVGKVTADKVFKAHSGMRFGLAILGDHYCIISNCPIRDLDPSEIESFILLTCGLADEMERNLKLGDKY